MNREPNYIIPPLLDELMQWEKEVKPNVPYLETPTGYFLQFDPADNGGYQSSPADAIVFANTGMDGTHYSFLTDFGAVTDLSEAPIVCVDPMDFGNCTRIVANNIREFFALHFSDHQGLLLNDFDSEARYLQYLKEQEVDEEDEDEEESGGYFSRAQWKRERGIVRDSALERFGFQLIPDGYAYMQEARLTRSLAAILPTSDGLGVTLHGATDAASTKPAAHPWQGKPIPERDAEQLVAYVENAEQSGLFGFIRDCQAQGVDNYEVVRAVCTRLFALGLPLEARRLASCMGI
ncbi:hypothetical protein [Paenibacillus xanthanilyticus]|uniref:SMI1/KNR4 family protein n=1 Tax=Paenibacillus xanthanilyticus TaxID=1783531 RepID=A0ABV8KDS5_9BACL